MGFLSLIKVWWDYSLHRHILVQFCEFYNKISPTRDSKVARSSFCPSFGVRAVWSLSFSIPSFKSVLELISVSSLISFLHFFSQNSSITAENMLQFWHRSGHQNHYQSVLTEATTDVDWFALIPGWCGLFFSLITCWCRSIPLMVRICILGRTVSQLVFVKQPRRNQNCTTKGTFV